MRNTLPGKRVLLDSSVIIAGLLSPTGGSAKILQHCRTGALRCFISPAIHNEVVINLPPKRAELKLLFESDCRQEYLKLISVKEKQLPKLVGQVDEKDIHVVQAAYNAGADFLVSLNRKHLVGNQRAQKAIPARIVSPKELIQTLGL